MRMFVKGSIVSLGCFGLLLIGAVAAQAADKPAGKPDPAKAFARKDADSDGQLTLEEFKKGMKDKQLENADKRFKQLDKDKDGKVSMDEFKAGMNRQKKTK